jgi:hypothetical protein
MHSRRDSCVPASPAPCAACAVSCPAHLCGSLALRSAVRSGAEHRHAGQGRSTLPAACISVPSACVPCAQPLFVHATCVVPSSSPLPCAHPLCALRRTANRTVRDSDAVRHQFATCEHAAHMYPMPNSRGRQCTQQLDQRSRPSCVCGLARACTRFVESSREFKARRPCLLTWAKRCIVSNWSFKNDIGVF